MGHSEEQERRAAVTVSLEELEQCQHFKLVLFVSTSDISFSRRTNRVSR